MFQYIVFHVHEDPSTNSGGTLSGNKLFTYVISKILKQCTDAQFSSFELKYAVHNCLRNVRYETEDVGTNLQRLLNYATLRGGFDGIDENLKKIGVQRIEVKEDGLLFMSE